MHRRSGCGDASAIAGDDGVHPVIVDVAVEDFGPYARTGETHVVVLPSGLRKGGHHHYILTCALEPAVECNHSIRIVHIERIDVVAAQSRLTPAQANEILRKSQMIYHRDVGSV